MYVILAVSPPHFFDLIVYSAEDKITERNMESRIFSYRLKLGVGCAKHVNFIIFVFRKQKSK